MSQPKLISGLHAEFTPAQWDGQNRSGIRVVGKTVLVLMDECSSVTSGDAGVAMRGEAGLKVEGPVSQVGIQLPPDVVEKMSLGAETGVLVAVSAGAFLLNEDGTPWSGEKPVPGDRVYIEKYAGKLIKGRDKKSYRLMDYGSIGATYEPETKESA